MKMNYTTVTHGNYSCWLIQLVTMVITNAILICEKIVMSYDLDSHGNYQCLFNSYIC